MIAQIPSIRIRQGNELPIQQGGRYILYWMIGCRRSTWSFSLQHAIRRAQEHGVGLLVFEPLRLCYPHASIRIHQFIVDGIAEQRKNFKEAGIGYYPYVERDQNEGKGLLLALAKQAISLVTDDITSAFYPNMIQAAADLVPCPLEVVDNDGLLPLAATERAWPTAHTFRRHLQKTLPSHLDRFPLAQPLLGHGIPLIKIPEHITSKWPVWETSASSPQKGLSTLPINQSVAPVEAIGGEEEARRKLQHFVQKRLARYEERNHPDEDASSELSAYLHFGHLSVFEVLSEVFSSHAWNPRQAAAKATGSRAGWWGLPPAVEGFLDQIITWRELGRTWAKHRPNDYMRYSSIPNWAQDSLALHSADPREHLYTTQQLENSQTHDSLWNAAQNQLRETGTIQNYLRMLWGKNVLAWTRNPEEAAEILVYLNDKWALDGRDPNSYSGIFWVFGRHDRAWGPQRPIYGKVRYMTSANTKRKLRMDLWLNRWSAPKDASA